MPIIFDAKMSSDKRKVELGAMTTLPTFDTENETARSA
jgi:hypothetical protein